MDERGCTLRGERRDSGTETGRSAEIIAMRTDGTARREAVCSLVMRGGDNGRCEARRRDVPPGMPHGSATAPLSTLPVVASVVGRCTVDVACTIACAGAYHPKLMKRSFGSIRQPVIVASGATDANVSKCQKSTPLGFWPTFRVSKRFRI